MGWESLAFRTYLTQEILILLGFAATYFMAN